jgi:SAM-dependent methyltransferase
MDLSERSADQATRHPWELARAHALQAVLARGGRGGLGRVLDIGCGDGFAGLFLRARLRASDYVGYDRELTDQQCQAWSSPARGIAFVNHAPDAAARFDTVLACDVIEHVADDAALVRDAWARIAPRGRLLVTVPAFQALFSAHDRALRHHRRYSLAQLRAVLEQAAAPPRGSGYLFGSLLLPRLASCASERLRPRATEPARPDARTVGIGGWKLPAWSSAIIAGALRAENRALLALASTGVKLPGLSAWALSVKPEIS